MMRNGSIGNIYYYNLENNPQKQCYRRIVSRMLDFSREIDVRDFCLKIDDISVIRQAIKYDHPELFNGCCLPFSCFTDPAGLVTKLEFRRDFSIEEELTMRHRIMEIAEDIKEQCYGLPDIDKEKLIHDYLMDNVEYGYLPDDKGVSYTLTGPLIYGRGVCQGIACAFRFLCEYAAGMPCCICIGGTPWWSSEEGHAWNMIEVDREPYHIDVTRDINGRDEDNASSGYVYFNCTTACMEKEHTISDIYPACTSDRYNYFAMKGLDAYSKEAMSDMIVRNIERREQAIAVRCSSEHDENQIKKSIPKIIKEDCCISEDIEFTYWVKGGVVLINAKYGSRAA